MNILFIHEIDWLKKVVYEIHTLPELLSLRGYNVYAIDYESMWRKTSSTDFGSLRTKQVSGVRHYLNAKVDLIRPGFVKVPVLSRASAFVTHYTAIKKTIEKYDIDVIILYSVPTNGLQTIRLAKRYNVPVVFRSLDTLNQLVKNKVLSIATSRMEKMVYSKADLVLAINTRLGEYCKRLGATNVKILPLGVDTDNFRPLDNVDKLRNKWNLVGKKVIVFMGTLPNFSGLDTFIIKFPEVLMEVPDAHLLIVGDGEQRLKLESLIHCHHLESYVTITGFQPFGKIPQYINLASVCISTFPIIGVTRDIVPLKVIQYMACGKPVVSTPLPGLTEMIEGENQGIVYSEDIRVIAKLLKSESYIQKLGVAALKYATRVHGDENIVNQLEQELINLVRARAKGILGVIEC